MSVNSLLFAYVVSFLAGLSVVALYYDYRQKRFEPRPSEDHVFRCESCGFVYTDDADVDRSCCPQCGIMNDSIYF